MVVAQQVKEEEKIAWMGLREIYRLVGSPEGNQIVRTLIKEPKMRSTQLMEKSEVSESKFHPIMRALVLCQLVEKKVLPDRGVEYNISPFGKHVLELSEPLLDKIRETFRDKKSVLLSIVQKPEGSL